jgi:hypothetical protein
MKEEILKKLNLHEIKKSKVEKDLSMPQNSLSGMLKGSKEIPSKWVKPLTEYIEKLDNPTPPISEPYERAAYLQKEAQQKPETEKAVESTQSGLEGLEFKKIAETNNSVEFTFTNRLEQPIEVWSNAAKIEPKTLVGDSNSKFDQLLKQFNSLVDLTDKPKDIKSKLEQIKETAKNSNLTPRQTDAIIDRCNNQLENKYNTSKHSLKLS